MSRRHLTAVELIEYADGDMYQAAAYAVEDHLRECDLCAASLSASRRVALATSRLGTLPAPLDIRDRVRTKLALDLAAALTCRQALPMLHEHVDHCLPPIPTMRLQGHLDSCAACRRELAALQSIAGLVRALPQAASPAGVRERVAEAARRREVRRAPKLRPALAAVGLIAVGVCALLVRPSVPTVQQAPGPVVAANPEPVTVAPVASEPEAAEATAPVEMAQDQPVKPEGGIESEPVALAAVHAERPVREVTAKKSRRSAPKAALTLASATSASPRPIIAAHRASSQVPAAMQVLRQVAQTADYSMEARRAMIQAVESIPVLSSEDNLDKVPEFAAAAPAAGDRPAAPASAPSEKQPGRNSVFAPERPMVVSTGSLA